MLETQMEVQTNGKFGQGKDLSVEEITEPGKLTTTTKIELQGNIISTEHTKELAEKIKTHTKRSEYACYGKWFIIFVLMVWGIILYTTRYLDPDENSTTNTETKKMNKIPVPHILLKFQCYDDGCWEPTRLYYPNYVANLTNCSINATTSIPTRNDLRHQGDETLCFFYNYQNISYIAIVPPKSANLPINYHDYITLALNFRRYTNTLGYYNISQSGSYYVARLWVFNRKHFMKKGVTDTGLNSPLMITPANVYETTLQVILKTRVWGFPKFGRKRRLKYELSFDGVASSTWCYEKSPWWLSDNDCETIIYINPPFDNSITKIVKSKKYNVFDVLSSIGGLYSLIIAFWAFFVGRLIWGHSKKYSGFCPYAQTDDYIVQRQTKNEMLRNKIAFQTEQRKCDALVLPKDKSLKCVLSSSTKDETNLKDSMSLDAKNNEELDKLNGNDGQE